MSITIMISLIVHISFLLCIGMMAVVAHKCQGSQIRTAFLIMLGVMLLWNVGTFLELDFRTATGVTYMLFIYICYIGICLIPIAILYLGKVILHPDWHPMPAHSAFLVMPLVSIAMVFTNHLHSLFFVVFSLDSSEAVYGAYYYCHALYSYGCITAGITFMFIASARNTGLFSKQSLFVILGIIITVIPNMLYSFGVGQLPFSISVAASTLSILCFAVSFLKFRFITALPISLRQVVDLISDGYLVIDRQSCILNYNQALLHLFPEPVKISLGENLRTFIERYFLDASYDRFMELQAQAVLQRKTVSEESHITGDTYVRVEITPVMQRNLHIGSIILLKDITQSRLLIETTKAASRAKSDFLAKMSHEIRTPMNAIMGMAELALREIEPENKNEHLVTIKQAGSNLLAIINDILDFSKIETGKQEIVTDNYPFSSLINDVISIIRTRIINSKIRFMVNTDRNIPGTLYGDETRIRQALINLLNNAVKYTKKGFVSLTVCGEFVDEGTVNLVMEVKDSGIGIHQEDIEKLFKDFSQFDLKKNKGIEGVGLGLPITEAIVKAMDGNISVQSQYGEGSTFTITLPQKYDTCEPLANVEEPDNKNVLIYERRRTYTNSIIRTLNNLGVKCTLVSSDSELDEKMANYPFSFLFISFFLFKNNKEVIDRYHDKTKVVLLAEFGRIIPQKNFNVLVMPEYSLSIANILNGKQESYSHDNNDKLFAGFIAPNAKILVVDDNKTNLKVAQGLLLPYEIQVDICTSGIAAIEAVQLNHYDLVLMDHRMPEMDGVEATRRIRETSTTDHNYKDLPIIALTANVVSGTKELLLENGFNDFLSKPIDTIRLNAILEKWIPKDKQTASTYNHNGETAENTIDIDGLDVKKGISLSGGKINLYLDTLATFYDDGFEVIEKLKTCLETGNLPLYTIYVHGLSTASAFIGADELSKAAKALEMAGDEEAMDFIVTHNEEFIKNMESLLVNINNAVNGAKTKSIVDTETLKSRLTEMKTALDNLDIGTINRLVDDLLTLTRATEINTVVRKISNSILLGEYDEAAAVTESLILAQH